MVLHDLHDRAFPYLRLSITDVCNYSCQYCLPDGYQCKDKPDFLTISEIHRLITAFSELGVWKIRITGGEPSIRKDFLEIASTINAIPGINHMAFTTNGYRLKNNAELWHTAGFHSINVSLDSLNPQVFHQITGQNRQTEVLAGIHKALAVGFESVKVNVVLLKGVNDHEINDFLSWVKHTPIHVRFIELMQTGDNFDYFNRHHISADFIKQKLLTNGWIKKIRNSSAGPAAIFSHSDYQGNIGIIAPYSKNFCDDCNRLRVTSTGDLRLCLFGNSGIPIRHLLQSDNQKEALKETIEQQLQFKRSKHFLALGDTGTTQNLSIIGG